MAGLKVTEAAGGVNRGSASPVHGLAAFPDLPLGVSDFVEAARFFNLCRARGAQGSNTDFLICAVAAREELAIYTADKDFKAFAKILPIALFEERSF